ncbi:hypothetical protein NDU88_004033 [Pleurodeles waltl]|uniref:Uncharacterized protein n=1 Tax=Pleurodeles waltl TaxID=8319 RepID=A0AAV7QET1_PLEWA|nr:hypothetical protein NDU88_004033 [Pleurodeles waltl]
MKRVPSSHDTSSVSVPTRPLSSRKRAEARKPQAACVQEISRKFLRNRCRITSVPGPAGRTRLISEGVGLLAVRLLVSRSHI